MRSSADWAKPRGKETASESVAVRARERETMRGRGRGKPARWPKNTENGSTIGAVKELPQFSRMVAGVQANSPCDGAAQVYCVFLRPRKKTKLVILKMG